MAEDIQEIDVIKQTTRDFFHSLGFEVAVEVHATSPFFSPHLAQTEEQGIAIKIPGENLGILIGFRGETLHSLQTILSLIINKRLMTELGISKEARRFITLDVAGWKQNREETLIDMAQRAIDKSIQVKNSVALPPLNGYERRIIHLYLNSLTGVKEWSEGEEPNRRIVVEAHDNV